MFFFSSAKFDRVQKKVIFFGNEPEFRYSLKKNILLLGYDKNIFF